MNAFPRGALIAIASVLVSGCGGPAESDVRLEFLLSNPDAQIVSLDVGEGDSEAVYYHIRYRTSGDTATREEEWQYLRRDGRWVNTSRRPRTGERLR
jgi:hypothetical protein